MAFTPEEREFLTSQRLGRVSTASSDAEPDVAVVGFSVDPDGEIVIGGLDNPRTIKWRNVLATGRAAFVVDDLVSITPWRPRGLKVRGISDIEGHHVIVIRPETVWSWGINRNAPTYFAGVVEKRTFNL
jgi:pyridoxamine 5'-phosphate oxidase family protein